MRKALLIICFLLTGAADHNDFADALGCYYQPAYGAVDTRTILFQAGYGNTPNMYRDAASFFAQKGFASLRCGVTWADASSALTLRQVGAAAVADYDDLARHEGADKNHVIGIGTSLGSFELILVSQQRPIEALILHAPAIYSDTASDQSLKMAIEADHGALVAWRKQPLSPKDNATLAALHDFAGEILLVKSGADEAVPAEAVANYQGANPRAQVFVLDGAHHGLSDSQLFALMSGKVLRWLSEPVLVAGKI